MSDVAADAGCDVTTLWRWRHDFAFRAEYNREKRELRDAVCGRLEKLAAAAADCLKKAVEAGDTKISLEVVKSLGLLSPRAIDSDDPRELEKEAELCAREREGDRRVRAKFASMGG